MKYMLQERDKNIIPAHDTNSSSDEDYTNKENRSFLNEQVTTSLSIFRKLQRSSVKDILKGITGTLNFEVVREKKIIKQNMPK